MRTLSCRLFKIMLQLASVISISQATYIGNQGNEYKINFTTVNAKFGKYYPRNVTLNYGYLFLYEHNNVDETVVRVTTTFTEFVNEDPDNFPLQVVIRQQLSVKSWSLPLVMQQEIKLDSVSRTLCSAGQAANSTLPVAVEATTFSTSPVMITVHAELLKNFTVSIGHTYNIFVTPSSPEYYQYTFDTSKDYRSVTLYLKSEEDRDCSIVSIQGAACPVQDLLQNNIEDGIIYQTFLKSAAIIIDKKPESDSVYIAFMVSPSDQSCAHMDRILPIGVAKVKHIEFWIEDHTEDTVYIFAILAAVAYCLLFYVSCLLYWAISRFWKRFRDSRDVELISSDSAARNYGAISDTTSATHQDSIEEDENEIAGDDVDDDVDILADIDEHKNVFRLKKNLMVSDMTRKGYSKLRKKYMLYQWNVVIISIFYGLPVVQLVLTYQRYLNFSGNQDTCYYNFLCSRKLGVLHSFNNVFSNIGYATLGILFIIIIYIRHRTENAKPAGLREKCGIPQHFGLFYAMGWALIVEGVMSASYHVCPSYNNFQFDTAFMYVLGGLLILRLFQSRHPDINANAHTAYLLLALVIGIAVIGVLFNTAVFWDVFTPFYLLVVFYMSLQIYYVGRFSFDRSLLHSLILYVKSDCCKCVSPLYPARLGLLTFLNLANWGLGLYGIITRPVDFATFMLAIIILNLMSYCMFYIAMKLVHKESIPLPSVVFSVFAVILWGFALYFFTHSLTNWQTTPAKSRNLNEPCLILDFFDGHDTWHFLSSGAMFCSFLVVLHIDDNLKDVPRERIPVF